MERGDVRSRADLQALCDDRLDRLAAARPTAVNLAHATQQLRELVRSVCAQREGTVRDAAERVVAAAETMLDDDLAANHALGRHGATFALARAAPDGPVRVVTHCNTGSLATAGYGTALGVIRRLHELGRLAQVYCTETRPYGQGARLTAYELVADRIPATLVCDSMVAALVQQHRIDMVIVGADRIAANGDTANKIGTYQLAIVARYHDVRAAAAARRGAARLAACRRSSGARQVPFYVAAPVASFDPSIASGAAIPVEERPARELTHVQARGRAKCRRSPRRPRRHPDRARRRRASASPRTGSTCGTRPSM